jgi:hypothetical protein
VEGHPDTRLVDMRAALESFWSRNKNGGFLLFGSVVLGLCADLDPHGDPREAGKSAQIY